MLQGVSFESLNFALYEYTIFGADWPSLQVVIGKTFEMMVFPAHAEFRSPWQPWLVFVVNQAVTLLTTYPTYKYQQHHVNHLDV